MTPTAPCPPSRTRFTRFVPSKSSRRKAPSASEMRVSLSNGGERSNVPGSARSDTSSICASAPEGYALLHNPCIAKV